MNGERGWILVERAEGPGEGDITPPEVELRIPYFVYRLRVFGNTPCKVLSAGIRFHLANMRKGELPAEPELPEEPDYWHDIYGNNLTGRSADIPIAGEVLPPCAYGYVSYADAFERSHETRFCWIYRVAANGLVFVNSTGRNIDAGRFRVGGPSEYNKQT